MTTHPGGRPSFAPTASALWLSKGHGTHNDFVLAYDPDDALEVTPTMVQAWCDRRGGIGADGFIRAVPAAVMIAQTPEGIGDAQWFMDYYNADGSVSEMCGNGIRVFGTFLSLAGAISPQLEPAVSHGVPIATRAGVKRLFVEDTRPTSMDWRVQMGTWKVGGTPGVADSPGDGSDVVVNAPGLGSTRRAGLFVDVGNPHVVVPLPAHADLTAVDLSTAPELEPAAPHGANVEFVVVEPQLRAGVGHLTMRVHERGVGETQSCGTGACAAALAAYVWAGAREDTPREWVVDVPGGRLGVDIEPETVWLSGPGEVVADILVP